MTKLVLQAVWPLSVLLAGLWALRLWRTDLFRRYPWLFTYLLVVFFPGLLGLYLYYSGLKVGGRSAYSIWWPIDQVALWLVSFGVVFEIFDRLLEGYRGLQRLGRLVVNGTLGLVGTLVIGSLVFDAFRFADLNSWKVFWLKQEQSITFFIAGSLFLLFLFQKVFHSVANPNVRLLFVVFSLMYAVESGLVVLRTYLGPEFRGLRDLVGTSVYAGCLLLGGLRFSPAGESAPAAAARREELSGAAGAAARRMKNFSDQLENILRA